MLSSLISVETKSQLLDPPQSLKLGRIDQADHQASFDAVVAQRNDVVNRIPIDSWGQVFFLLLTESSTVKALWIPGQLRFLKKVAAFQFRPDALAQTGDWIPFFGQQNRILGFPVPALFLCKGIFQG